MKKPDRVEAGQRWVTSPGSEPYCFTQDEASASGEVWWRWVLGDDDAIYLGSGEHPEPSEWMIETLAEHAYASTVQCGDPDLNPSWTALRDVQREYYRNGAVCSLTEVVSFMTGGFKRCVLSLYRILRGLGKW